MSRLIPLLVLAVSALTGCAHTCAPETFLKPSMVAPAGTRVGGNGRHLYVFAGAPVVMRVAECAAPSRTTDSAPAMICMDFWVEEGATVSWAKPAFLFTAPNGDSLGESVLSDPLLTFPGGRDPTATALTGGVMYFDGWNHHVLTVQAPAFSSTDFTLQPPGLVVNGRQWPTLKFRFQQVTEDVCRPST